MTIVLLLLTSFLHISFAKPPEPNDDRQQIIDHIHSIFKAYVRQDAAEVRALHTDDWTGFRNNSRQIVKGIEGYMRGVTFKRFKMLEYEIEDIEVQLYGDLGVVYYIANWKTLSIQTNEVVSIRARAVDIYRKAPEGWNQAGSNLNILPMPRAMAIPDCGKCFDVQRVQADKE
jgi:ketosteroid isomerase-like protein